MKFIYILLLLMVANNTAFSQDSDSVWYFFENRDTERINREDKGVVRILKVRPRGNSYWVSRFGNDNFLQAEYGTSDSLAKLKNGLYKEYDVEGQLRLERYYTDNQLNGISYIYRGGELVDSNTYKNNHLTGKGFLYHSFSKEKNYEFDLDEDGNGEMKYIGNEFKPFTVKYVDGKRNGMVLYESPKVKTRTEVTYVDGKVDKFKGWDADGNPIPKDSLKLFEYASYAGIKGWRSYLMSNLRYPDEAVRKGIEGTVRVIFTVDENGNTSDFRVISSPDKLLSDEALRIVSKSGIWKPAKEFNIPVKYRQIQPIVFRLQ